MDESDNVFEPDSSPPAKKIQPKSEIQSKRKSLVVPWKDVDEFKKVYSWIYGKNATDETKRLACRQMTVWKIRRINLTPAAVLGTLVILEIQLKDALRSINITVEGLKDLQILYASAFTRFFNYMSSIMQTKGMRSMYETAKELNLRSFVVDLRHICAHGQDMPSIEVLRSTSKYCLKWLNEFYWSTQSESMQNVDTKHIRRKDQTKFEENIAQLFRYYDAALECAIKGEQKISKKYIKGERYQAVMAYFEKKNIADVNQLLAEIVKDLGNAVRVQREMMDLSEIFNEEILQMRFFFKLVQTHVETDEQLENLVYHTQSLFRMLAIYGLLEDLFTALLAIAENKNQEVPRRKAASFWAIQLVNGFIAFRRCKEIYKKEREQNPSKNYDLLSLNFEHTSKQILTLYTRIGINAKRTLIFGDSVRRPWVWTFDREFVEERLRHANQYTVEILKSVLYLVDPELTDEEINTLRELFDLKISNDLSAECDVKLSDQTDAEKIYTADDVLKHIGAGDGDCVMQDASGGGDDSGVIKYGVWSTAPDCQDWYACPIGRLIWD